MSSLNQDFTRSGNSVFENVYIYGNLDYQFKSISVDDLEVRGNSYTTGIATFADDVYIYGELDISYLTVRNRFNVGSGGTVFVGINTGELSGRVGIGTTQPLEKFQLNIDNSSVVVTAGGTVGIGTTTPFGNWVDGNIEFSESAQGPLKLEVDGSVHIDRNIYDSVGSPGENNYWLKRDEHGIRWQPIPPSLDQEGIKVQDEGVYVPISVGTAQTFDTLNFVQSNSLGLGTDTLLPTAANIISPTGVATIFTFDLWGFDGEGDNASIYRQTNVGILTVSPIAPLQVGAGGSESVVVTGIGSVGIGTTNPVQRFQVGVPDSDGGAYTVITKTGFVGIHTIDPEYALDVWEDAYLRRKLTVSRHTELDFTLNVDQGATFQSTVDVDGDTTLDKLTVDELAIFNDETPATSTLSASVQLDGGLGIVKNLIMGGIAELRSNQSSTSPATGALQVTGGVGIGENLWIGNELNVKGNTVLGDTTGDSTTVSGTLHVESLIESVGIDTGAVVVEGGVGVKRNVSVGGSLTVSGLSTFVGTVELESSLLDINDDNGFSDAVGVCKTDYRLASVGTGVSWRPSGVQTKNAIWVSMNGCDSNSGLLEGDSKRTIGGAAAIAQTGDTIIVRSGVYKENNPIGLRTEVTVSGEDLRLVTVVPLNTNKDVFQVRAGCLIQNMNFAGITSPTNHPHCGAVAFPPTAEGVALGKDFQAVTGYTALGPANQGPDRIDPSKGGRYRSPYVRNCTNFMTGSIGMKINGDYVNAAFTGVNDLGQDLKSMVCDSFTQYNENGIGVSITNNAYAQLVSIFTIGCDIAIFCGSGGQCDLTNSNSSFGNVGLKADGIGDVEFTGITNVSSIGGQDVIAINNVRDIEENVRKPFDGQGAYFQIDLDNYPDTNATGILTAPLQFIRSIDIIDGGTGYAPGSPPNVTVPNPLGPESILPEFSANVSAAGTISSIDIIASGRNFLPNQELPVTFSSGDAIARVNTDPVLYTVSESTEPNPLSGLTNVTFNEFIPYSIGAGVSVAFSRLSRIITSSHSFEYVGAGTDLNRANPFQGGEPIPENEVISINGGQVPYTSTDQKGNFRIGDGLTIDQTTSTISGRDFNRAIQAQLTPLILSLR
tara:strand:+ start:9441 stop:12776 length:3336 start_codon:yes stop_codon:yes gene_type:complete